MKRFAKIVIYFEPLTISAKNSISDVWQGSEYASACCKQTFFFQRSDQELSGTRKKFCYFRVISSFPKILIPGINWFDKSWKWSFNRVLQIFPNTNSERERTARGGAAVYHVYDSTLLVTSKALECGM